MENIEILSVVAVTFRGQDSSAVKWEPLWRTGLPPSTKSNSATSRAKLTRWLS